MGLLSQTAYFRLTHLTDLAPQSVHRPVMIWGRPPVCQFRSVLQTGLHQPVAGARVPGNGQAGGLPH